MNTNRKREYLTPDEVEKLIEAAKDNRHGHRDATMILTTYRHGLRASEVCALEWHDVDFTKAELHVRRAKNGKPAVHPIRGDELRALRRLQREQSPRSQWIFTTERGAPMLPDSLGKLVRRLGKGSQLLGFSIHPHMLRHGCGFALANAGHDTRLIQDYLGHANISNTVRYTELSATKFKNVWR
ncbi:MAG: tyrosine-type recombinase/integrase [Hyphomicrobiales bacterium]|nr:tyrosine-type recombinase/integrase [Hyphomicrobiales bacterium]